MTGAQQHGEQFRPDAHRALRNFASGLFVRRRWQFRRPLADLFLRFILRDAVALLNLSDERVLLPSKALHVVIGELRPLRLGLPFELFPLPCDLIPVHSILR